MQAFVFRPTFSNSFFRFCMFFTIEIIGKTRPFWEIPVRQKGRGQTRRGYYGKFKPGWNFQFARLSSRRWKSRIAFLVRNAQGLFWMSRNLPLWPSGKVFGKTCPFREIPVRREIRGQTGRGYYGNCLKRSGGNYTVCIYFVYYHIMHCDLLSQNFVQESCTHACTTQATDPALLGGCLDLWRSRVYLDYTIATDKSAR